MRLGAGLPRIVGDLVLLPGVRFDAHAVPENPLAPAAALRVGRLASETDVLVLHTRFQSATAGGAACLSAGRALMRDRAGPRVCGDMRVSTVVGTQVSSTVFAAMTFTVRAVVGMGAMRKLVGVLFGHSYLWSCFVVGRNFISDKRR